MSLHYLVKLTSPNNVKISTQIPRSPPAAPVKPRTASDGSVAVHCEHDVMLVSD